ncbi:MAG: hypothetical protein ABSC92_06990 [Rhizomicrobium sp.]|jgi:uncharacterized membrane protein
MSMLREMTTLAYVFHVVGGTLALISGTVAVFARKGGRLHRAAGNVFFISMLTMAAFAAYLGVVVPDRANIFGAAFVAYLVGTAWLTVRRKEGTIGIPEKIALVAALVLFAPFAILAFQLATGMAPLFKSTVAFKGPVLIAMYSIAFVLAVAVIGDAKIVFAGGISGAPRIARHLWRMCVGLMMATGSAFTNGLPRLLPGPMHVTPIFFLPQFIPLGLLVFWMIRVRLTGGYKMAEQGA